MTNKERIKELEHELERYRKKVSDQNAIMKDVLAQAKETNKANRILARAYEALVIRMGLTYGEDAEDPDFPGKVIGKRLTLPNVNEEELLKKWQSMARQDEPTNNVVIAVGLRDDPDDHKRDRE